MRCAAALVTRRGDPGPGAVTGTLVAALAAGAVPVFLTGALQGRIADELGIGVAAIGVSVAAFFVSAGVTSIPIGRIVDGIGSPLALRVGMGIAASASGAIAAFVSRPWHLTAWLMLGGVAMALVDAAGSRALSRAVPRHRQGLAFGSKEASGPLASLLAGMTLPVIGAELGWRPAYAGAAVLAVITGALVSSRLDVMRGTTDESGSRGRDAGQDRGHETGDDLGREPGHEPGHERGSGAAVSRGTTRAAPIARAPGATGPGPSTAPLLALLALSAASAGSVASSVATFLVPTGELAGLSAAAAGVVLAAASLASVITRVGSGAAVDRWTGSELGAVGLLAGVGAFGVLGLALVSGPLAGAAAAVPLLVVAAVLALGGGWGWTGLLFLAGIRVEPRRPALSGGVVLAGLGLGGSVGPAVFGALAERLGFAVTWAVAVPCMAVATGIALLLRHRVRLRDARSANGSGPAGASPATWSASGAAT